MLVNAEYAYPVTLGRFDLDFLSKCRVAQANSVKMDLNQLCDALRMILYLKDFAQIAS